MTVATSSPNLQYLLSTFTTSLLSTTTSLPSTIPNSTSGISLLDLKNDIFLSYLHHLSYLLLFRIRNNSLSSSDGAELVKKLAELRIWLDRGVKPCENKLKYQVEKVLRAAADWERGDIRKSRGGNARSGDDDEEITSESDEEQGEDEDEEEQLPTTTNYDSDDLSTNKKSKAQLDTVTMKNALSYRPNPTLLSKPASASLSAANGDKEGIYRPPKLNPVTMPSEHPEKSDSRKEKKEKSRTIDDFITAEFSVAPTAEPSIGSTIGRKGKTATARERRDETERREYEESNFVRLPALSKKEMKQKIKVLGGGGKDGWGGEDWRGIERGMGLDRIERLTKKSGNGGALERSRKRGNDEFEGRGGGRIGEKFEKRRKVMDRDRRRGK